jgi:outer membrane protein TolC
LLLKKQVDESKATAKRDLAELEKIRQNVYLEVKQAYIDVQNAKDSIPVAQLAMMQAKEQYDLASGRYKVGLGDAVELKDAENTYRKAQLEYYSNLMNYNISVANLERVTGSPISPVVDENSTKEHT